MFYNDNNCAFADSDILPFDKTLTSSVLMVRLAEFVTLAFLSIASYRFAVIIWIICQTHFDTLLISMCVVAIILCITAFKCIGDILDSIIEKKITQLKLNIQNQETTIEQLYVTMEQFKDIIRKQDEELVSLKIM